MGWPPFTWVKTIPQRLFFKMLSRSRGVVFDRTMPSSHPVMVVRITAGTAFRLAAIPKGPQRSITASSTRGAELFEALDPPPAQVGEAVVPQKRLRPATVQHDPLDSVADFTVLDAVLPGADRDAVGARDDAVDDPESSRRGRRG